MSYEFHFRMFSINTVLLAMVCAIITPTLARPSKEANTESTTDSVVAASATAGEKPKLESYLLGEPNSPIGTTPPPM